MYGLFQAVKDTGLAASHPSRCCLLLDTGVEVFRPAAALSDGLCAQSCVQPAREMENPAWSRSLKPLRSLAAGLERDKNPGPRRVGHLETVARHDLELHVGLQLTQFRFMV